MKALTISPQPRFRCKVHGVTDTYIEFSLDDAPPECVCLYCYRDWMAKEFGLMEKLEGGEKP